MALIVRPLDNEVGPAPHLSAHLVAPGGFGKTTALLSMPRPLLIGDVDGGLESLFKKAVPNRDGIFVAFIKTHIDAQDLFRTAWKEGPDKKPFASVALDTFTSYMSKVVKGEILRMTGREKMELQDWGLYFERGIIVANLAHELAMRPDGCHTLLTCHEADKGGDDNQIGKLGPAVSGQLFDILPGIPNYMFFLRIIRTGKIIQGTPEMARVFQTEADHRTPAKSRRDLLKNEPPDFTAIWEKVKPSIGKEVT